MAKEFDITIKENDSTVLQIKTIFDKILYPLNDRSFEKTSPAAFESLLNGAIKESKIGDNINIKQAIEILEKKCTRAFK